MRPDDLIIPSWGSSDIPYWSEMTLSKHVKLVKENPGQWLPILEEWYGGCVYGGYLEDRSVFFDERHDPTAVIHVGVDLWAPQYTPIHFPFNAVVKYSRPENPHCRGGWGGRLDLFVPEQGVYILGHLDTPFQKIGDFIMAGEIIGSLAGKEKNGGWLPHLHVQLMPLDYYNIFEPNSIDAYTELDYNNNLIKLYLNPFHERPITY